MTTTEKEKDKTASTKIENIETLLLNNYEFRFNTIKCKPEKRITGTTTWEQVDKYFINSLKRELDSYHVTASTQTIKEILSSNFARRVNPITEYLNGLQYNGENNIKKLSETVTVANPEQWENYLKKWLIAVIANAIIDQGCQNHTMLVLTGGQGKFKTTWLDNLCPKDLSPYLYTGKIDVNSKDSLTHIAEFFLINIDDQLRQLNKKDENDLKNLITTPSVKYRRPYDEFIMEYPHIASFMGSVNGNDFLTDPTGSRRFLPFEVLEIDINRAKALDIPQVWAQAVYLFRQGARYWFDRDEIEELNLNNSAFQVTTSEEQLLLTYFERPKSRGEASHFLTNAEILSHLITQGRINNLSTKKLGEALAKWNFEKWQKTKSGVPLWVYSVIKKDIMTVDRESQNEQQINKF